MEQNISYFPTTCNPSSNHPDSDTFNLPKASNHDVVNLGMYRLKKSLQKEGFEIVEDKKGKITLVVRVNNR